MTQRTLIKIVMLILLLVSAYFSLRWSIWMMGLAAHFFWIGLKGFLFAVLILLTVGFGTHILFGKKE